MRHLKIRTKTNPRRDGSCLATPLVCEAAHRYDNNRSEKSLKRLQCQLIVGAADSGKAHWLNRLHDRWQDKYIWGSKDKVLPVYLSVLQLLSSWTDAPHVEQRKEQGEDAPLLDSDGIFLQAINCYPEPTKFNVKLNLEGGLRT